MVIGILVFNKLVSRDGILDKKLKHHAGYDSTSLLVPLFFLRNIFTPAQILCFCFYVCGDSEERSRGTVEPV